MKKLFLFSLLAVMLGLAYPAHAQSWQWALCSTGAGYTQMSRAVATDAQGNVFVAGQMNNTVVFGGPSTAFYSIGTPGFLGKLNAAGQWQWVVEVPMASIVHRISINAAVADGAGNLYLTGVLHGTATFGTTTLNSGRGCLFVAKINGLGQWQWAVGSTSSSSGNNDPTGLALALDPASGDVVVVGTTSGTSSFGGTTLTALGPANGSIDDGLVVRLNAATGQWLWAKSLGTNSVDALSGVALDGAGNMYVAGFVVDALALPGLPVLPAQGQFDGVAAKLSANGQTWLWANRFGSAREDYGVATLPLASGEVVVVGTFITNLTLGGTVLNATGRDVYLARLAGNTGQVVAGSARRAGGVGDETLGSVQADQNGNLLLAGSYTNAAVFGSTTCPPAPAGYTNAYVARYLASGTWPWALTASGGNNVAGQQLSADPTGTHVYLAGMTARSAQFGTLPPISPTNGSSGGSFFVARMGSVLATRPAALGGQAVQLWPNPAAGTCAVRVPALPGTPHVAGTLLDGLGRAVRTLTLPTGATTALNLGGLPAGLYTLRLAAGAEATALRLAVE